MKVQILFFFLELILCSKKEYEKSAKIKKSRNKRTIIIGSIIILVLGFILFIMFFLSYLIRKKNLQRIRNNNLIKREEKELNIKKKEYLFQNELKPKKLKLKIPENIFNECPICLDNIIENNIVSYTPCHHIYHYDCFKNYLFFTSDSHCPLCKYDLFSIFNQNINFQQLNIDYLNINNNKIEELFINNLPSYHQSYINNNSSNSKINIENINNSFIVNNNLNKEVENNLNDNQIKEEIYKDVVCSNCENNNKENISKSSNEEVIITSPIIIKKKIENDEFSNIPIKEIENKKNSYINENENNDNDSFKSITYKKINLDNNDENKNSENIDNENINSNATFVN